MANPKENEKGQRIWKWLIIGNGNFVIPVTTNELISSSYCR
jgi:hypothetical protein